MWDYSNTVFSLQKSTSSGDAILPIANVRIEKTTDMNSAQKENHEFPGKSSLAMANNRIENLEEQLRLRDKQIQDLTMQISKLAVEYDVEAILDVRHLKNKKREYLIRWKGFSPNSDSWQPEDNLSCDELLKNFLNNFDDVDEDKIDDVGEDDDGDDDDGNVDQARGGSDPHGDVDYCPPKMLSLTTQSRKSARQSKPVTHLTYTHQPVCCVCSTKLLLVDGIQGPLVCSMACAQAMETNQ